MSSTCSFQNQEVHRKILLHCAFVFQLWQRWDLSQSAFPSCMRGTLNWRLGNYLGSHWDHLFIMIWDLIGILSSYSIGWCFETCTGFHLKCVQCHCKDSAIVMATAAVPPCQPSLAGKALPQHPHLSDLWISKTTWVFFRREILNSSCITCTISESIKRQCDSMERSFDLEYLNYATLVTLMKSTNLCLSFLTEGSNRGHIWHPWRCTDSH